ncbi:hypothetical protein [Roseateles sp. L2-2]|uniref:hypothetical protein n=1 Tax=Roseateles sp. L2-2 TaxID=3422597 RepID=UPI003D36ABF1
MPLAAAGQVAVPQGWVPQETMQIPVVCRASGQPSECRLLMSQEQLVRLGLVLAPSDTATSVTKATAVAAAAAASGPIASTMEAASDGGKSGGAKKAATAAAVATDVDAFSTATSRMKADLSVPASPGLAILGLSSDKAQRPGVLREFAASLAQGLSPDGKVTNGVAMDFNPMSLFFRDHLRGGTLYGPRDGEGNRDFLTSNYGTRVLARTTVSVAATKPDDSGASRAAWGVRIGLVDQADPGLYYRSLASCVRRQLAPDVPVEMSLTPQPADLGVCYDEIGKTNPLWAQPSLYAGFGQSWYSSTAKLTDAKGAGKSLWLAGSYDFAGKNGEDTAGGWRVLLQGFYSRRLDDRAKDPDDAAKLVRQDSKEATLRLKAGQATRHFFADYGFRRVRLGDVQKERLRTLSIGAELRLPFSTEESEYWLQFAGLREQGYSDGKARNAVNLSLRFGVPFLELPGPAVDGK